MARRSARAVLAMEAAGVRIGDILTQEALENAMVVHAAFGGRPISFFIYPRWRMRPVCKGRLWKIGLP